MTIAQQLLVRTLYKELCNAREAMENGNYREVISLANHNINDLKKQVVTGSTDLPDILLGITVSLLNLRGCSICMQYRRLHFAEDDFRSALAVARQLKPIPQLDVTQINSDTNLNLALVMLLQDQESPKTQRQLRRAKEVLGDHPHINALLDPQISQAKDWRAALRWQ